MSRSLNKVMLIGNLGKDPEIKHTPAGVPVAQFSLATSDSWKDKEGNFQEKTEWHNIVAWRGLAEVCSKYLKKGSKIYAEGKLQTRTYDDPNGQKKYFTEVVLDNMVMLDAKREGDHEPSSVSESSNAGEEDIPF